MSYLLINDSNYQRHVTDIADGRFGDRKLAGCLPRRTAFGECSVAASMPESMLIPRSEWPDRIRQKDSEKSWVKDICARIPCMDQDGLNYCVTEDTEVLTNRGWVLWPDYRDGDLLGTVNPTTHFLEFQRPLRRQVFEHKGEIICSTNRRMDFTVTPHHRMYVRKWDEAKRRLSREYQFVTAENLGWYSGLMAAPKGFVGTEIVEAEIPGDRRYDGDDFLAMVAMLVADGYAGTSESTKNWVSFCCFDSLHYDRVAALASRLGFHEQATRKGVWRRTDAGALAEWVRVNCYTNIDAKASGKRIPEIVKWVSSRQIKHFLTWYLDQDHKEPLKTFFSVSDQIVDDLQELLLRIGRRSTPYWASPQRSMISETGKVIQSNGVWHLCVSQTDRLCLDRKKHIEQDRYNGLVYCATVPNGTLVTRKNGSVLISGNCHAYGPVMAAMCHRLVQNQPHVMLSAESVGGPVTNWKNQGAYPEDDLQQMVNFGACPADMMDAPLSRKPSKWDPEWEVERFKYRVIEWLDGMLERGKAFDAAMTMAILNLAGAAGFTWWGHEVAYCLHAQDLGRGKFAIGGRNSWGKDYGDDGFFYLEEGKGTPDIHLFAVLHMLASG